MKPDFHNRKIKLIVLELEADRLAKELRAVRAEIRELKKEQGKEAK